MTTQACQWAGVETAGLGGPREFRGRASSGAARVRGQVTDGKRCGKKAAHQESRRSPDSNLAVRTRDCAPLASRAGEVCHFLGKSVQRSRFFESPRWSVLPDSSCVRNAVTWSRSAVVATGVSAIAAASARKQPAAGNSGRRAAATSRAAVAATITPAASAAIGLRKIKRLCGFTSKE